MAYAFRDELIHRDRALAYRFSRFEVVLLAGMAITGIGLATVYLARKVDFAEEPEVSEAVPEVEDTVWVGYEDTVPPEDYFQVDIFEGVTNDGVEVRGRVVGYPLRRREIKVDDQRSGREVVVALKNLERFRIQRRPFADDERPFYRWKIVRPGGEENHLYGYLVEETETGYLLELEAGRVTIPKSAVLEFVSEPSGR